MTTNLYHWRVYCTTESRFRFWWIPDTDPEPTTCPVDTDHSINAAVTTLIGKTEKNPPTEENRDLFNNVLTNSSTPIIQNYFTNDLANPQLFTITKSGASSNTISNGLATITNGANIGDSILVRSKKIIAYRPGSAVRIRSALAFDSNAVAGSMQLFGSGNTINGIYIGYTDSDFGVRYERNGKHEIRRLTVTANSSGTETITITLNDVVFTGTIETSGTLAFTTHQIGDMTTYTGYYVQQIDNELVFATTESVEETGTFSFASNGTAAGTFTRDYAGKVPTVVSVARAQLNGDRTIIDRLNPDKLNMYEIEYSWYGVGNFTFKVYDEISQRFKLLHTFTFNNSSDTVSVSQPSMYIQRIVKSISSTTALTMKTAGTSAYYENNILIPNTPRYNVSTSKNLLSGVETNVMVLTQKLISNGYLTPQPNLIRNITLVNDSNKSARFRIILNPATISAGTSSDFTNFQYVNEEFGSLVYDTTSDTYSGGDVIYESFIPSNGFRELDIAEEELDIGFGDTVVFSVRATQASEFDISITFVQLC